MIRTELLLEEQQAAEQEFLKTHPRWEPRLNVIKYYCWQHSNLDTLDVELFNTQETSALLTPISSRQTFAQRETLLAAPSGFFLPIPLDINFLEFAYQSTPTEVIALLKLLEEVSGENETYLKEIIYRNKALIQIRPINLFDRIKQRMANDETLFSEETRQNYPSIYRILGGFEKTLRLPGLKRARMEWNSTYSGAFKMYLMNIIALEPIETMPIEEFESFINWFDQFVLYITVQFLLLTPGTLIALLDRFGTIRDVFSVLISEQTIFSNRKAGTITNQIAIEYIRRWDEFQGFPPEWSLGILQNSEEK